MRWILLLIGLCLGALGLAYAAGRGVTAMQWDPKVVCPEMTMEERLAGQITTLVQYTGATYGLVLRGSLREPEAGGVDRIERLTIIRDEQLIRTDRFERRTVRGAYDITIPRYVMGGDGDVPRPFPSLFITSACVPDHPVKLRIWEPGDDEPISIDPARDLRLRETISAELGEDSFVGPRAIVPRIAGRLQTTIPGCSRLGIVGGARLGGDSLHHHGINGLVCLDAQEAVIRLALGPFLGGRFASVAVLDVDGDGVDEVLVTYRLASDTGEGLGRELLWFDAAEKIFKVIDLGTSSTL